MGGRGCAEGGAVEELDGGVCDVARDAEVILRRGHLGHRLRRVPVHRDRLDAAALRGRRVLRAPRRVLGSGQLLDELCARVTERDEARDA